MKPRVSFASGSFKHNGFTITWRDRVVTIRKEAVDPEFFDLTLTTARALLNMFHPIYPGSSWGTDGIGYRVNRRLNLVEVHKSGVGVQGFRRGMEELGRIAARRV